MVDSVHNPYTPVPGQTVGRQNVSSPSTPQPGIQQQVPIPEFDMDKLVTTVRKRLVRELKWDREGRKGIR